MTREPEPSRRPELRPTRLTAFRQVDRGAPLSPLRLSLGFRGGEFGLALLGMESRFGAAALFAELATFLRRRNQHDRMQPLTILTHSPSPRDSRTAVILGGSNHDRPCFGGGRSRRFGAPGDE